MVKLVEATLEQSGDKHAWPWGMAESSFAPTMSNGKEWPRISVVTPSFNQGQFLEETIRSVLLQGYPNLEYIIIDGGSTDASVTIIKKYESHISYWQSKKDNGQADAIAQGFDKATGEILSWLNSDDILLPGVLTEIARVFERNAAVGVVFGNTLVIDRDSSEIDRYFWPGVLFRYHWSLGQYLGQESCFWRADVYRKVGGVDRDRFFTMDFDLFFRMWKVTRFKKIRRFVGAFRVHEEAKNSKYQDVRLKEFNDAKERYGIKEMGYLMRRLANRIDRVQNKLERLLFFLGTFRKESTRHGSRPLDQSSPPVSS